MVITTLPITIRISFPKKLCSRLRAFDNIAGEFFEDAQCCDGMRVFFLSIVLTRCLHHESICFEVCCCKREDAIHFWRQTRLRTTMDRTQPYFTTYCESKDGLSSGGSWNLSMLDDNILHELTAFNHADESAYHHLANMFICRP
jgi:hypothetical protein